MRGKRRGTTVGALAGVRYVTPHPHDVLSSFLFIVFGRGCGRRGPVNADAVDADTVDAVDAVDADAVDADRLATKTPTAAYVGDDRRRFRGGEVRHPASP